MLPFFTQKGGFKHEKITEKAFRIRQCGDPLCTAGVRVHADFRGISDCEKYCSQLSGCYGADTDKAGQTFCGPAELYRDLPGSGVYTVADQYACIYGVLPGVPVYHRIPAGAVF